jgi:hypothetical protein
MSPVIDASIFAMADLYSLSISLRVWIGPSIASLAAAVI